MHLRRFWTVVAATGFLYAAASEFRVPGVHYPAQVREGVSILPGGRALRPFGRQVLTGTGAFAIAVSPSGKSIVTNNIGVSVAIGLNRPSITVIVPGKRDTAWNLSDYPAEPRQARPQSWQGLTTGLVVTSDSSAWVSEGDTGRIVELSLSSGTRKAAINLNGDSYAHSFSDAMAYDSGRNLLIVLDQANARAALVDLKKATAAASVKTGQLPVALALGDDGKRLYVVNKGAGKGSLSIIDIRNPAAAQATSEVALPGDGSAGGVAVRGDEVYVSLPHQDAVAAVNGLTGNVNAEIPLRIPGLESYRGITPLGLAFDPASGRLLVAEAGINAVGVIDPETRQVLGHIPVGWFPNAIAVHEGEVYVASARGFGTGPSEPAHLIRMFGGGKPQAFETDTAVLRRGSVSAFRVPPDVDLAHHTETVMQAAGFTLLGKTEISQTETKPVPPIRNVVLIVKGNRSFDEILGDVDRAGDRRVFAEPTYARFGTDGYVSGHRRHFSLRVDVTPNHHEIASRWSFGDNFYSDAEYPSAGFERLMAACPDRQSEISLLYREAGNRFPWEMTDRGRLWSHLEEYKIDFRDFSQETAGDRRRADSFIETVTKEYLEAGKPLPHFILLRLPGDTTGLARGEEEYPYEASYVAENDHAVGRVLDFLSRTPWWKKMAIFITEAGADGGADHIDSHRTLLLGAGPWFRTNYVSHTNSSAPALLRTIFKLLNVPPINLYDATASDLLDMFGAVPDSTPYDLKAEDSRLFVE